MESDHPKPIDHQRPPLQHASSLPPLTTQLGGKGTMRRRRLRKSASLSSQHDLSNSELMHQFLQRGQFQEFGKLDRVTFISDNGTLTSYDSVPVNANLKSNMYHLNLSHYHIPARKKSKTKLTEVMLKQHQQQPTPKPITDTAESLLLNSQSKQEIYELVGTDGFDYLLNLVKGNHELISRLRNRDVANNKLTETVPPADTLSEIPETDIDQSVSFDTIATISSMNSKEDSTYSKFETNLTPNTNSLDVASSAEDIDVSNSSGINLNSSCESAANLEAIEEDQVVEIADKHPPPTSLPNITESSLEETIEFNQIKKKKKRVFIHEEYEDNENEEKIATRKLSASATQLNLNNRPSLPSNINNMMNSQLLDSNYSIDYDTTSSASSLQHKTTQSNTERVKIRNTKSLDNDDDNLITSTTSVISSDEASNLTTSRTNNKKKIAKKKESQLEKETSELRSLAFLRYKPPVAKKSSKATKTIKLNSDATQSGSDGGSGNKKNKAIIQKSLSLNNDEIDDEARSNANSQKFKSLSSLKSLEIIDEIEDSGLNTLTNETEEEEIKRTKPARSEQGGIKKKSSPRKPDNKAKSKRLANSLASLSSPSTSSTDSSVTIMSNQDPPTQSMPDLNDSTTSKKSKKNNKNRKKPTHKPSDTSVASATLSTSVKNIRRVEELFNDQESEVESNNRRDADNKEDEQLTGNTSSSSSRLTEFINIEPNRIVSTRRGESIDLKYEDNQSSNSIIDDKLNELDTSESNNKSELKNYNSAPPTEEPNLKIKPHEESVLNYNKSVNHDKSIDSIKDSIIIPEQEIQSNMSDDNSRPDQQPPKVTTHDEEDDDITRLIRNINSNPTGVGYSSSDDNLSNLSDKRASAGIEHQSKLDESFDELENIDNVISDVISDFNQKERNFDYVQRNMTQISSSPAVASSSDLLKVQESSENLLSSITSSENVRKSGGDDNFYSSTNIYSTDSNEDTTYRDEQMRAEFNNLVDKFVDAPIRRSTALLDDTIKSDEGEDKSEFNNIVDTFIEAETLPSASDKSDEFNTVIARFVESNLEKRIHDDSLKQDKSLTNEDVQDDSLNDSTNNDVDEFKKIVDNFIETRRSEILDDSIESDKLDYNKKQSVEDLDDSLKSDNLEKSTEVFGKVVDEFIEPIKSDDEQESSLKENQALTKSSHSFGESYLDNSIHSEKNISLEKLEHPKEEDVNNLSTTSSSSDSKDLHPEPIKSDQEEHSVHSENDRSDKADTPPTSPIELKPSDVASFNKIADEFIQATESLKSTDLAKTDSDSEHILDDSLTNEEIKNKLDESIKSEQDIDASRDHDVAKLDESKPLSETDDSNEDSSRVRHIESPLDKSSVSDKLKEELNNSDVGSREDQSPSELKEFVSIGQPLAMSSIDFEKEERDEQSSQLLDESASREQSSLNVIQSDNKQNSLNENIREELSDDEQSDFNKLADKFIEASEKKSPDDSLNTSQIDQSNSDFNEAQVLARAISRLDDKSFGNEPESDLEASGVSTRDASDVKRVVDKFIETPSEHVSLNESLDNSREESINQESHDVSNLKEQSSESSESLSNQQPKLDLKESDKDESLELEKSTSNVKLIEQEVTASGLQDNSSDQSGHFDYVVDKFIEKEPASNEVENSLDSSISSENRIDDDSTKQAQPELRSQESRLSENRDESVPVSVNVSVDEKLATSTKSLDQFEQDPLDKSQNSEPDVETRVVESVKVSIASTGLNTEKEHESEPSSTHADSAPVSVVKEEQTEFNKVVDEFIKREASSLDESQLDKSLDRSAHEQNTSAVLTDEDVNQPEEEGLDRIAEMSDESLDSSLNISLKRSIDNETEHKRIETESLHPVVETEQAKENESENILDSNVEDSSIEVKLAHQVEQKVEKSESASKQPDEESISEHVNELNSTQDSKHDESLSELDQSAVDVKSVEQPVHEDNEQSEFNQLVDNFIQKESVSSQSSLDHSAQKNLSESNVQVPVKSETVESDKEEANSEAESLDSSLNLSINDSKSSLVRVVQEILSTEPAIVEEELKQELDANIELKSQTVNIEEPANKVPEELGHIALEEIKPADNEDGNSEQESLDSSLDLSINDTKSSLVRIVQEVLSNEPAIVEEELNQSTELKSHQDFDQNELEQVPVTTSTIEISDTVKVEELSNRSLQEARSENDSINSSLSEKDTRVSDKDELNDQSLLHRKASDLPEIRFQHDTDESVHEDQEPLDSSVLSESKPTEQREEILSDLESVASEQNEFNKLVDKFIENEAQSREESLDNSLDLSAQKPEPNVEPEIVESDKESLDNSLDLSIKSSLVKIVQEVLSSEPVVVQEELNPHEESTKKTTEESSHVNLEEIKQQSDHSGEESLDSSLDLSINDTKSSIMHEVLSNEPVIVEELNQSSELKSHESQESLGKEMKVPETRQTTFLESSDKQSIDEPQSRETSTDSKSEIVSEPVSELNSRESSRESSELNIDIKPQISDDEKVEFNKLVDKFIEKEASPNDLSTQKQDQVGEIGQLVDRFIQPDDSTDVKSVDQPISVQSNENKVSTGPDQEIREVSITEPDVETRVVESVKVSIASTGLNIEKEHESEPSSTHADTAPVSVVEEEQTEFNKVVDEFIKREASSLDESQVDKSLDRSAHVVSSQPEKEIEADEALNTSLDVSADHSVSFVTKDVPLSNIPVDSSVDKPKSVSKEESFDEISAEEALEAQKELEHSLSKSENLTKSSDSITDPVSLPVHDKYTEETRIIQTKEEFVVVDSKESESFQRVIDQFIESPRTVDTISADQTIPDETAKDTPVKIEIEKLNIPEPIQLDSSSNSSQSPVSPGTQREFNTLVDAFIVKETFTQIIQDQQVPENKQVVEIEEEEIPISIPANNTEVPSHQYRYSNLTETYFTPSNNSQQKLTTLTSKLNLDLDSLITREEELFNLEEKRTSNLQSAINDNEPLDFKTKLRYFNSISSPSSSSNPFVESQSSSANVPLAASSALNKRYFDDRNSVRFEDDYDFAQVSSLPRTGATTTVDSDTPENFELIKVSIINKRPITPDIDEVLNDTCEEHYLDRSFPYTASVNGAAGDDLNGNYMYDQKRLSSLDPSIANEYDPGMSSMSYRSSSIYLREINKNGTAVPISVEHQRTFRDSNPFWTQDSVSLKSNQRYTSIDPTTGTYNTVGHNRKSNGSAYETYESSNRGSYNSGSMYNAYNNNTYYQSNPFRDTSSVAPSAQPLNPASLTNYTSYPIEIQNTRPSHLPPKDINIAIISSDTLEKNKLVQQRSDDEPLFRHDMKEIQQEALKNFNKRQPMIDSEYGAKTYDAMTSSKLFIPIEGKKETNQPHGISHLFTRIVNVFRLPFNNKKSQIKDNQSQPAAPGSNITKSRSEYKQHLLNEQDEVIELDIDREGKVFTIDNELAAGKSSKISKQSGKSSSKNVHKDVTPKEVAKMRKSKTQQDVKSNTTSGWKCCLF